MKNNWKEERLIYSGWMHFVLSIILFVGSIFSMVITVYLGERYSQNWNLLLLITFPLSMFTGIAWMGDGTWQMFLCSHGLWPKPKKLRSGGNGCPDSRFEFWP